jgi:inhibitor of KinA sporulation pathway (predicted exonuclease)
MILVIDFESTCEDGRPAGYHYQIIEIGAVWATPEGEALDQLSLLVQAENPVSKFCTKLTGITQEDVDGGLPFSAAMQALAEFAAKYPAMEWASWGNADLTSIEFDCTHHGIESPLKGWTHRNLKKEFAKAHRIKPQVGMARALEIAGFALDGSHHRALPDALNTVKFLPHIAAVSAMRDSLFYREKARREALWLSLIQDPEQRAQILKTLALIEHLDRRSPIGDGTKLTTAELRKSVRIVPYSSGTIAHVIESEIPQPWRERFQQASAGSTKGSKDTAYAHDWLKFLEFWDKENDY